ncbi:MAG: hypothetical protein MPW14_17245 [Candidatus Manganitrophus sp.]|nr:MAG: hypothetical protein MPW14_17245 [Candidatus Manganitrophus sp.]
MMKVFRWRLPSLKNSACARPGIIRKIRFCSGHFSLVWKPTML